MVEDLYIALLRVIVSGLGVQVRNKGIDVYAMGHGTLFDIFETGNGASNTMQAVLQKNPDRLRILFNHFLNGHVLCDSHVLTSLYNTSMYVV